MDRALAAGYLAELLPRLADAETSALARPRTGDQKAGGNSQAHWTYGLTAGHIRVRPLTDEQTAHAAPACPECGGTQPPAASRRKASCCAVSTSPISSA